MIYLDYNATTPIHPAVREAMLPFLAERYANPTSSHAMGRREREAVEKARAQVATLIGASPEEVMFTSGGTESNNHAIKGAAWTKEDVGKHIILSAVEHPATSNPCRFLERHGFEITVVPVDRHGRVDPHSIVEEIRGTTVLVSIMHANNEVGTIQPIAEIAGITREAGVWLHSDAAQSCGKIPTRVDELGVDFLSIAGHKLYAPKGVGALYVRKEISIEPLLHGAGHENGRRAGTEALPAIVGLGAACELARTDPPAAHMKSMRDRLHDRLRERLGDRAVSLGHPELRLPNTLAIGFCGAFGGDVMTKCPELAASLGAACHKTGDRKRSATLDAMGVPDEVAYGMIRFSTGRSTKAEEVERAAEMIVKAL